ncbi:MAG: glycosyltransferase family 2 protein [Planctomycetaceae bacterium]|nr:glycosyltransferase family 2 protein [Planctomycetaceae bacterium]
MDQGHVDRTIASVVIPTYNGSRTIHLPLRGLASQEGLSGVFEVIVVDNASTDDISAVVEADPSTRRLRERGHSVRIVREGRQGLTHARIRGCLEAQAEPVCCLDDDTIPVPGYIAAAVAGFTDPQVGVLISRVFPVYEVPPRQALARREHLLAINRRMGDRQIAWSAGPMLVPTLGAGLWFRREAFLRAVPMDHPERLLTDRIGGKLVSGGDIEIGYLIGQAGYTRVYLPELQLEHHIPRARLRLGYALRLIQGIVRSELTLRARYGTPESGWMRWLQATSGVILSPLACLRPDPWGEVAMVAAARLALWRGPYLLPPAPVTVPGAVGTRVEVDRGGSADEACGNALARVRPSRNGPTVDRVG